MFHSAATFGLSGTRLAVGLGVARYARLGFGTTKYNIRYYFWCISGARARNTYQDCTSLVPGMYLHLGVRVRGVYQRTGMRVPRLYLSTLPRRNDMVHGRGEQRRPRQVPQAWARPIVNRDYSCDLKIRLFARLLVEIVAPCETRRIHSCRGVGRVLNNSDIFLFLVD